MRHHSCLPVLIYIAALNGSAEGKLQIFRVGPAGIHFKEGLPARGSIARNTSQGLATDGSYTWEAANFPLPRELGAVRVFIGGAPAPILLLVPAPTGYDIRVQVPLDAKAEPGTGTVPVEIRTSDDSAMVSVPFLQTPGDFLNPPKGTPGLIPGRDGLFLHASDYSLVTPGHPAQPGESLITYMTGLPGSVPAVPTGEPAPFEPLPVVPRGEAISTAAPFYELRLSHVGPAQQQTTRMTPSFLGLAPGLAGVYQVNFTLPNYWTNGVTAVTLHCWILPESSGRSNMSGNP